MSMANGLSRSLRVRGSLRSGVSSILFVLLYGQRPVWRTLPVLGVGLLLNPLKVFRRRESYQAL